MEVRDHYHATTGDNDIKHDYDHSGDHHHHSAPGLDYYIRHTHDGHDDPGYDYDHFTNGNYIPPCTDNDCPGELLHRPKPRDG